MAYRNARIVVGRYVLKLCTPRVAIALKMCILRKNRFDKI